MPQQKCKHCKHPIKKTNYALGPEWDHYDPNSSFPSRSRGTSWKYCRTSIAEPEEAECLSNAEKSSSSQEKSSSVSKSFTEPNSITTEELSRSVIHEGRRPNGGSIGSLGSFH